LPLRLHERFPRLARLELVRGDVNIGPDAFADFGVAELARLSTLVELELMDIKSLGTRAAMALRECCPQLQALNLYRTGACGEQPVVYGAGLPSEAAAHELRAPLTSPSADPAGVASPYALQMLACLTRLTCLELGRTGVAAGLQQLTSLKSLASLSVMDCKDVTDDHLQCLSALRGLTRLAASWTGVEGTSLAALSSLRHLDLDRCSSLDIAALAAVVQLTRLTFLDLSCSTTEAEPAQLAQLARLTNLQHLRLWGHTIRQQAAVLLELPCLGQLCADSVTVSQGQDLSGCAVTRLALHKPTAADLQALPQLPALQSLLIGIAAHGLSGISVQTQLTELVIESSARVRASELAAALQGLQQLQALELFEAGCFDMECLAAMAGMQQLQELWLDGGKDGPDQPDMGECWGLLHRCAQLQRVTLQRCGPVSQGALVALVGHVAMKQVTLGGEHGLSDEAVEAVEAVGAMYGCELLFEQESSQAPRAGSEFFIFDL
jgi:hypothetical protein